MSGSPLSRVALMLLQRVLASSRFLDLRHQLTPDSTCPTAALGKGVNGSDSAWALLLLYGEFLGHS